MRKLDANLIILASESLTNTIAFYPSGIYWTTIYLINEPAGYLENCTLLIGYFSKILISTLIFTIQISVVILSEKWEDNSKKY